MTGDRWPRRCYLLPQGSWKSCFWCWPGHPPHHHPSAHHPPPPSVPLDPAPCWHRWCRKGWRSLWGPAGPWCPCLTAGWREHFPHSAGCPPLWWPTLHGQCRKPREGLARRLDHPHAGEGWWWWLLVVVCRCCSWPPRWGWHGCCGWRCPAACHHAATGLSSHCCPLRVVLALVVGRFLYNCTTINQVQIVAKWYHLHWSPDCNLQSVTRNAEDKQARPRCRLRQYKTGMGIKNGKVSWKVGAWGPGKLKLKLFNKNKT